MAGILEYIFHYSVWQKYLKSRRSYLRTSYALVIFSGCISGTIILIARRLETVHPKLLMIFCIPKTYVSAGVPSIMIDDSNDTRSEMATGIIAIRRLPRWNSDVVFCRPPANAWNTPIPMEATMVMPKMM